MEFADKMMHRFPKIFSIAKDPPDFAADSCRCPAPPRTKRRHWHNALRNPESSPSSSTSNPSCSERESPRPSHQGLDDCNRSFRVDGSEEGLETICKSFGFSGISDISIAPEEYEEIKSISSSLDDVLDKVQFSDSKPSEGDSVDTVGFPSGIDAIRVLDGIDEHVTEVRCSPSTSDLVCQKLDDNVEFRNEDRIRDSVVGPSVTTGNVLSDKSKAFRGNAIKGLRPRELLRPPLKSLLAEDEDFDTWDAPRHALGIDSGVSRLKTKLYVGESEAEIQDRVEDDMRRNMVNEENPLLSGSCSFTTSSADDDSSSTTTERMSNISPTGKFEVVIGDWQKGDLIGHGSVGSVYEGFADCGLIFAVKQVSLLDQGEEGKQRIIQLQQEIALLSQFEHKNIVRYYGTKKDESHLYIFLELVPKGSLLSLYKKYDLRVPQVSNYTRQILRGLKYLHDRNIIHRDIKCANILVETNRSVKLADFGLAKVIALNDVISCKGTAFWMAPEVVRGQGYGLAADIWSLGCTVLEMLTRSFPYSNMERMAALYKIGSGEMPPIPNSISGDARDMVRKCLQVDPSQRPTATQLLSHPFVKR